MTVLLQIFSWFDNEIIVKIGQYLVKLRRTNMMPFWATLYVGQTNRYYVCYRSVEVCWQLSSISVIRSSCYSFRWQSTAVSSRPHLPPSSVRWINGSLAICCWANYSARVLCYRPTLRFFCYVHKWNWSIVWFKGIQLHFMRWWAFKHLFILLLFVIFIYFKRVCFFLAV